MPQVDCNAFHSNPTEPNRVICQRDTLGVRGYLKVVICGKYINLNKITKI